MIFNKYTFKMNQGEYNERRNCKTGFGRRVRQIARRKADGVELPSLYNYGMYTKDIKNQNTALYNAGIAEAYMKIRIRDSSYLFQILLI